MILVGVGCVMFGVMWFMFEGVVIDLKLFVFDCG